MSLHSDPESCCLYSVDYGEYFETLTASVGSKPEEIDFRGGVGGDSSPANTQLKVITDRNEVVENPKLTQQLY